MSSNQIDNNSNNNSNISNNNSDGIPILPSEEEKTRKYQQYFEKMKEREESRKAKIVDRKSNQMHSSQANETPDYFWQEFKKEKLGIEQIFDNFEEILKNQEITPAQLIQDIDQRLESLQKFINDSTLFLTPHDLRYSSNHMTDLKSQATIIRDKHAPRKKFAFKPRTKEIQQNDTTKKSFKELESQKMNEKLHTTTHASNFNDTNAFILKDSMNETITIVGSYIAGKDLMLSDLQKCHITIYGNPTAVHMTNITDCKIAIGPVMTSIMIHYSLNSQFCLACQQLRIHNSKLSDFYIHVTSRAIIEDSTELRFSDYSWKYSQLDQDFITSGLDPNINNWKLVNDFHWLSINEPSPNWRVLENIEKVIWNNI